MESLNKLVRDIILVPDLDKKQPWQAHTDWVGQICAIVNLIPGLGGTIAQEIQSTINAVSNYKAAEFLRKLTCFVCNLGEVTDEQRLLFVDEIEQVAEDNAGNVILGIVDRLDSIHKQRILANLVKAKVLGFISVQDFFRLSSALERIPYVDIEQLPNYCKDYYDPNGDTELLFASGVLVQTLADIEGNKYRLSALGVKLMTFGLQVNVEFKEARGTKTLARLG
ncbi:MAG: hypothetical protein MJZ41_14940 [Bacteroidaceae bacterium]|nr:hypothetical protein [Bacteroidaceae bacterium]